MVAADPAQTAQILANVLCEQPEIWGECEEVAQFQARVAIMRGFLPGLPDISDAAIKSEDAGWLAPYLSGVSRLVDAQKIDFLGALKSRLEYSQLAALERDLPASVQLPGGQARVDYEQPVPQAEARAQAFFGLKTTPKLAGGRVALRLALLSPAGRPIAVTADLESFWRGGWADARRDMRGRYPKHDWPEDPGAAPHVPRPRANSSK